MSRTRRLAVWWMRTHPEDFQDFVPERFGTGTNRLDRYLDYMGTDKVYGDNLALQALCACYKAHVFVLKRGDSGAGDMRWMWSEHGQAQDSLSCFYLYLSDVHYENLIVDSQHR